MQKFLLKNLDCANCAARIEDAVQNLDGVRFASVDFASATLFLDADDHLRVHKIVKAVEPKIELHPKDHTGTVSDFDARKKLIPIIAAGGLFFGGLFFADSLQVSLFGLGYYLVFGLAYLISGWGVLSSAVRNISQGRVFDENFLMSVATLGAMAIGEFPEAVGVMLFFMVGEFVQDLSVHRSRRSIQALLKVRPDSARLLVKDETRNVDPEAVKVDDLILVRP